LCSLHCVSEEIITGENLGLTKSGGEHDTFAGLGARANNSSEQVNVGTWRGLIDVRSNLDGPDSLYYPAGREPMRGFPWLFT
jgi:hypothetical protein